MQTCASVTTRGDVFPAVTRNSHINPGIPEAAPDTAAPQTQIDVAAERLSPAEGTGSQLHMQKCACVATNGEVFQAVNTVPTTSATSASQELKSPNFGQPNDQTLDHSADSLLSSFASPIDSREEIAAVDIDDITVVLEKAAS